MGSFQVYDALSIFFELRKLPIEHFEGFILPRKESAELQKKFRIFNQKFQLKNSKESLVGSAKVGASMVQGLFTIITTCCYGERLIEIGIESRLLSTIP